jgi:PqqD family protein of HPr-rel-A system
VEPPSDTQLQPDPDVVSRRLGDELVLVHLGTNRIFRLNNTAARLWELIGDGIDTDAGLHDALRAEFDVGEEELRDEIAGTLERLRRQGLVRGGSQAG